MKYAFLLSNWYSGATLLSLLLNSNSDIVCNGETFPFNSNDRRRHSCSCGEYIDKCTFYKETAWVNSNEDFPKSWDYENAVITPRFHDNNIINRYFSSPLRESKVRNYLIEKSTISNKVNDFINNQKSFYKKAIQFKGAKIYIDGTKSIRRLQLFASQLPQEKIKVIHLVRDGRAFCNSFIKNRDLDENSLESATSQWNDYITMVDEVSNINSHVEIIHIRYEDLCDKQKLTLRSIRDFLDSDISEDFGDKKITQHVLGNRMRKNFTFEIKKDLSWKKQLSEISIESITKRMSTNLKRFDYL